MGYVDYVPVTGDYREVYNIFAIISGNPRKHRPVQYQIDKRNGTVEIFVHFIQVQIISVFFHHKEVLVMDNVSSHTGGVASSIQTLFWETPIQGTLATACTYSVPTCHVLTQTQSN
jgi:hypothetical protein